MEAVKIRLEPRKAGFDSLVICTDPEKREDKGVFAPVESDWFRGLEVLWHDGIIDKGEIN